jgi:hypothetical protein
MDHTSRRKAMATIDLGLASAAGLTSVMKAMYRAGAEKVIKAMGPKALERWNQNVQSITFYPDTESINRFVQTLRPDLAGLTGIRGLCLRDPSRPSLCNLHLNGGSDAGDETSWKTSNIYAHEFAHAIDWGADQPYPLSATKAWRETGGEEKREIRERLGVPDRGSAEDFANFAGVAWGYPEDARRHYPECWGFWVSGGLAAGDLAC